MSTSSNNSEKKVVRYGEFEVAEDGAISLLVDGKEVVFPLDEATGIVMTVIAARKVGYEARRNAKAAENAARKEAREKSKKERAKKQKSDAKSKAAKLRKQLARLDAIAAGN